MVSKKAKLMVQFYEECQKKGYTDMTDDTQSLKAKVIATDMNLKYKNMVSFYEEAKECYYALQKEKEEQAQKEAAERAEDAKSKLLLTFHTSSAMYEIAVFMREDETTVYHMIDGNKRVDGSPKLKAERGTITFANYKAPEAVYTGATVGGITTGGVHYTKGGYKYSETKSDRGTIKVYVEGSYYEVDHVVFSDFVIEKFKRSDFFKTNVKNNVMSCFNENKKSALYGSPTMASDKAAVAAQMTSFSFASDEKKLMMYECESRISYLKDIMNCDFPESDDEIYDRALKLSEGETSAELKKASCLFKGILDYKDSKAQYEKCCSKYEELLQTEKEQAVLERERQSAENKKHLKIGIIATVIIVIASVVMYFASGIINDNKTYKYGISLMEEKKYEEAMAEFEKLDDFKDSKIQILECEYQLGILFSKTGNFEEAAKKFDAIKDYKDSDTLLSESVYQSAMELIGKGEFDSGIEKLQGLGDYKDSKEQITLAEKEKKYIQAEAMIKEPGDHTEAYNIFKELGDYKNSKKLLKSFVRRVVNRGLPGGSSGASYGYDSAGYVINLEGREFTYSKDRLTRYRKTESHTIVEKFDSKGNLLSYTYFTDSDSKMWGYEFSYEYDGKGQITKQIETKYLYYSSNKPFNKTVRTFTRNKDNAVIKEETKSIFSSGSTHTSKESVSYEEKDKGYTVMEKGDFAYRTGWVYAPDATEKSELLASKYLYNPNMMGYTGFNY